MLTWSSLPPPVSAARSCISPSVEDLTCQTTDQMPSRYTCGPWISSLLRYPKTPCPSLCFSNCSDALLFFWWLHWHRMLGKLKNKTKLLSGWGDAQRVGWGGAAVLPALHRIWFWSLAPMSGRSLHMTQSPFILRVWVWVHTIGLTLTYLLIERLYLQIQSHLEVITLKSLGNTAQVTPLD